ncbi:MAG: hypothetical protein HY293_04585 [Planctomycetes bacterium]|nr:hypothetical protein [Planctomycetota bacterium]
MKEYSRREIMGLFGAAGAAAALLPGRLFAERVSQDKVIFGDGVHKYEWIPNWAKLPAGMKYVGSTHGNVGVDSKDRAYFNTDTDNAVMIFEQDGTFVKAWGKEFRGAHGMKIAKEGDKEVLWLCSLGRSEVIKLTLDGEVLLTIPFPEKSGVYKAKGEYKPTGCAVAPNGDVYVGDGYGKSWVHQWNAKGEYIRSWNGSERDGGKFNTPHGMCIDLRGKDPLVVVADRANGRLQWFTLDGKFVTETKEGMRNPCTLNFFGDDIIVPDLQGRITILGKDNKLIAHLGENSEKALIGKNPVPPEKWKDGEFTAPHGACWDSKGDLYVEDWNATGRINKMKRIK